MKRISTTQIGDGKLPNKYWVAIANDYFISKNNCLDWISDEKFFEVKSKTLKIFDSYSKAKEFVDSIYLGEIIDNILVNVITIEDRISGQLYEKVKVFLPKRAKFIEESFENIAFTQKKFKEKNLSFV